MDKGEKLLTEDQQQHTRQMIANFGAIYGGIYEVNKQMLNIAQNEPELSESEAELLSEFANGLNRILEQTQALERTARVLLNIACGQMN